jgi:16S rRNA (uracil1498-N3)-methyltransferase
VERWRRIAQEASEQSRRLRPPSIDAPARLPDALADTAEHRIWLDERPGAPAMLQAFPLGTGGTVSLAVGPEGGWSDAEREQFRAASWSGTSLGPSVLRSETAVCAALAVVLQMRLADTKT